MKEGDRFVDVVPTVPPDKLMERARQLLEKNGYKPPPKPKEPKKEEPEPVEEPPLEEKIKKRAKTGPKTVEGKAKSLANLRSLKRNTSVDDVKPEELHRLAFDYDELIDFFTDEEKAFLTKRKSEYVEAYGEFDKGADRANLHFILQEELHLNRLYTLLHFSRKSEDVGKLESRIEKAVKRLDLLTNNLKVQKKQRPDTANAGSLTSAMQEYESDPEKYEEQMKKEEEEMMKKRKK